MNQNTARVKCQCEICKNTHAIDIDSDLVSDLLAGNVTIFAGAGISTESRLVLKETFYEQILQEVGAKQANLAFPELMEMYCSAPNGRIKLLQQIAGRFQNISAFPEMDRVASRFHHELATLFPVKNIITTNWDTYFETACNATPFVTHADLAFWEGAERRVLKIHGSISNYGSIVATSSDYAKCKKSLSTGLIGSLLKSILATQTVIFVGYSMSDSDFNYIYSFVKKQMQGMHRHAYVVTPFPKDADRFRALGLTPMVTDGAHFLRLIKAHAVSIGLMLPDDIYHSAYQLLENVFREHKILHEEFSAATNPEIIYAASYQDGLMHNVMHSYLTIQKAKRSQGRYEDVSYIEGYINGLVFLLMDDNAKGISQVPLYYAPGLDQDMFSIEDYKQRIKDMPAAHKRAYKRACAYIKQQNTADGIEYHHPAWL